MSEFRRRMRRRLLAMGAFGAPAASAADLLIDDCDTLWTGTTGFARNVHSTPTVGGTGYTVGDILTVGAGGAQTQVAAVDGTGVVTDANNRSVDRAYSGGFGGYTAGGGQATTGGTGTGCTVNVSDVRNVAVSAEAGGLRFTPAASAPSRTLIGYHAISPGDLSAYTKLRLTYNNSAALGASDWRVCLCSDALGQVVVHEFRIPATVGTGAPLTVELDPTVAGPLAGTIASIMIGTGAASGVVSGNILLDDILAIA